MSSIITPFSQASPLGRSMVFTLQGPMSHWQVSTVTLASTWAKKKKTLLAPWMQKVQTFMNWIMKQGLNKQGCVELNDLELNEKFWIENDFLSCRWNVGLFWLFSVQASFAFNGDDTIEESGRIRRIVSTGDPFSMSTNFSVGCFLLSFWVIILFYIKMKIG